MNNKSKNSQTRKRHGGVNAGLCFTSNIFCLLGRMMLMTVVVQLLNNNNNNVQAKSLIHEKFDSKLKLLQSPSSSLIKMRHRRDTFANERQQAGGPTDSDYYDDNYDVLPGGRENGSSVTEGDQISEKAQQVAESFKNMWQSLTDSVRHCIDALRAMFGEEANDEELTPEQEQQILAEMEERYRLKHQQDNEVIMNVYQNSL